MSETTTLDRPAAPPATTPPWDRVRFRADASTTSDAAPPEPDVRELPPVAPWAATLARAAVEVLTGSRPSAQLARWLTADLYEALVRRAGLAVRINGRPAQALCARVRRVRCSEVRPGVHEVAVVVHDGVRVRAAAVRVECRRGRWQATALEIG